MAINMFSFFSHHIPIQRLAIQWPCLVINKWPTTISVAKGRHLQLWTRLYCFSDCASFISHDSRIRSIVLLVRTEQLYSLFWMDFIVLFNHVCCSSRFVTVPLEISLVIKFIHKLRWSSKYHLPFRVGEEARKTPNENKINRRSLSVTATLQPVLNVIHCALIARANSIKYKIQFDTITL